MIRRYATCFSLGILAMAASAVTPARESADERSALAYVEPAPPAVYGQAPMIVAGPNVVIGWHGDRYWDGRRWWAREEWNRRHPQGKELRHDDHRDDHRDQPRDDHRDDQHDDRRG